MNDNWKFSDLPYPSPDVEALQARYDALTQRAKDAQGPEELLEVVRQRDALQQEVSLCQSIAFIRAFHDVADEFYQRELQETLPQLETLDTQSLSMAIAESPYAAAVDEAFGPQLRRLLTLDQRLRTGGKELQARISRLTAQYQQLAASTKYQVQGETLSGGQLRLALTSTHRERRKAAYDALPEDLQAVVDEAGMEACVWEREYLAEAETAWLDELEAVGMQINYPEKDAFVEATKSVYDEFVGDEAGKVSPELLEKVYEIIDRE